MDHLIADILESTETLIKSDAIDLESLAAQRNPRIEKLVQSLGERTRPKQDGKSKGILRAIC
jgi:hypothetical protein